MCGHSQLQDSRRIADIKFTGLTLSLGKYLLVYDVTFPWVIGRIDFDKKVDEFCNFSSR